MNEQHFRRLKVVYLREVHALSGEKRMYPVGTKDSTKKTTTIFALSKLWESVNAIRTHPSIETPYPSEVNFVVGLETPDEGLLKPEREHD